MVPGWFFTVPECFLWFSRFQVSFLVPECFFYSFSRFRVGVLLFQVVFHGSRLVFHSARMFCYGFSRFQVSFLVPECF